MHSFNILDWRSWSADSSDTTTKDSINRVPAMLRRRLSPQGRATISTMLNLTDSYGEMPIVYCSRHGEVDRTIKLLKSLADNEPLSPTSFSLSVHNASLGLYSIHQKITQNISAIAAGRDYVIPVLLEALGLINDGHEKVMCVFSDFPLPEPYQAQTPEPERGFALALVVDAQNKLKLLRNGTATSSKYQIQELQELLLHKRTELSLSCNGSSWTIKKVCP